MFKKGLLLALMHGIPVEEPGFTIVRPCSNNFELERRTLESGVGNPGRTWVWMQRVMRSVIPTLGAGLFLTEAEGHQCLFLFRRHLLGKLADKFDTEDMAGGILMGLPGACVRFVAWYAHQHNNVNIESDMIIKAQNHVMRSNESFLEWVDTQDQLLQVVSVEKRNTMIVPKLLTLLRAGFVLNELST